MCFLWVPWFFSKCYDPVAGLRMREFISKWTVGNFLPSFCKAGYEMAIGRTVACKELFLYKYNWKLTVIFFQHKFMHVKFSNSREDNGIISVIMCNKWRWVLYGCSGHLQVLYKQIIVLFFQLDFSWQCYQMWMLPLNSTESFLC